jgi:hypothetical protein
VNGCNPPKRARPSWWHQAALKQPESHPDLHRLPPAVRGARPAHHPTVRPARRTVPGAGMDRHQPLRLYGPAHAPLVCRATGQADIQSVLRGVVVCGGGGVADGASGLNGVLKAAGCATCCRTASLRLRLKHQHRVFSGRIGLRTNKDQATFMPY